MIRNVSIMFLLRMWMYGVIHSYVLLHAAAIVQPRNIRSVIRFSPRPTAPTSVGNNYLIHSPALPNPELIYFSGAGLYFWWQLGVAKYLRENCEPNFLRKVPVAAASAGCITTTLLLTNADLDSLPDLALDVADKAGVLDGKVGLKGVGGELLREWLHRALPERAITSELFENVQISISPKIGRPKLVKGFSNKDQLIEAIMASCHVPLFLDGKMYADYGGEKVLDGAFWYFVTKRRNMGLPLPPQIAKDRIFWVDHLDDLDFRQSVQSNFLTFVGKEGMCDMIESGYNYMKREHYYGRLPFAKQRRPNFVRIPLRELRIPLAARQRLSRPLSGWTQSAESKATAVADTKVEQEIASVYSSRIPLIRNPWGSNTNSADKVLAAAGVAAAVTDVVNGGSGSSIDGTELADGSSSSSRREGVLRVAQQVTRYLAPMGRFGSIYQFESSVIASTTERNQTVEEVLSLDTSSSSSTPENYFARFGKLLKRSNSESAQIAAAVPVTTSTSWGRFIAAREVPPPMQESKQSDNSSDSGNDSSRERRFQMLNVNAWRRQRERISDSNTQS